MHPPLNAPVFATHTHSPMVESVAPNETESINKILTSIRIRRIGSTSIRFDNVLVGWLVFIMCSVYSFCVLIMSYRRAVCWFFADSSFSATLCTSRYALVYLSVSIILLQQREMRSTHNSNTSQDIALART